MSLDGLKVDHAGLERSADDLMTVVDAIGARMEALERELTPLRTSWVGQAQLAYTAAKAQWDRAVEEMRELLRSTAEQVRSSNAEYARTDSAGARSFGS